MPWLLEYAAGALCVVLVLSDIFRTVLLPRPTHRALRLGPILGRSVGPLWRGLAGRMRSPRTRQTLRASLAPLLLVASILIWVAVLILGYAAMLHARRFDMQPPPGFGDALFHAGSAFTTIGFTSVHISGPSRVTVVLAGMTGLAGVTILATFILSVQSSLQDREVRVIQIGVITRAPPTGLALLVGIGRNDSHDRLAVVFRTWNDWAADVLQSHRANPILMHFRSAEEDCEWLAALGAVLDAASIVLAVADEDRMNAASSAAREFLLTGTHVLRQLAAIFRVEGGLDAAEPGPSRRCEARELDSVREALAKAGYAVTAGPEALDRLNRLRSAYLDDLCALAERFDVRIERNIAARGAGRGGPLQAGSGFDPAG
jgi:hypothetical protein